MDLKKICDNEIYLNKDIPINISKDILNFAESGFKEIQTSKKVLDLFKSLGISISYPSFAYQVISPCLSMYFCFAKWDSL